MHSQHTWRRCSTGSFCVTLALALLATSVLVMPAMAKSDKKVSDVAKGKVESGEMLQLIVAYESRPGNLERQRVKYLGGKVRRQYKKINKLAVELPADAVEALAQDPGVAWVTLDQKVQANMDVATPLAGVTEAIKAPGGYTGAGVAVAVLDTGLDRHLDIQNQLVLMVDILQGGVIGGVFDQSGHGTHIAGIIAGDGGESSGFYTGVAPDAAILAVRVLDRTGAGYASDVIAGIDWVLENKDTYGIQVANFSLGHTVQESIETDPLVQAVERLWDAGVVVVCSAGNNGRDGYFTITSPGNSPKVITVGSLTDMNTPDTTDDFVSTYSSRGPAPGDLVVKPDLIAPGNRVVSLRATQSDLDKYYKDLRVRAPGARKDLYFELSGTSMASAFVAGAAALMLEADPTLNPATVKARLMRSAKKVSGNPFDAGAGLLDIEAAINETGFVSVAPSPRAFRHENPAAVGVEDTANLWSDATFGLAQLWSDAILWSDAQLWSDANLWSDAILWSDGFVEGDAILWSDANLWSDAILWSDHEVWSDANLWSDAILWSDAVIWSDAELEGNSTLWGE